MACTATLKRRHDCLVEMPELPLKRRRFVPSQEVMAPSSPSSSPPPVRPSSSVSSANINNNNNNNNSQQSTTSAFPSLLSRLSSDELSSRIMCELSRSRRRSEEDSSVSVRQLQQTCARLLQEFEHQIRSEYDKILSDKLSEQYEAFVRYTQDHLRSNSTSHSMTYVS